MEAKELKKLTDEVEAEVRESIKDRVKEQIKYTLSSELATVVSASVSKFIKEHIAPAVDKELVANKDAILGATIKAASAVGDELANAIIVSFKDRVKNSWERDKIISAFLGK